MQTNSVVAAPEIVPRELWEEEYNLRRCIPSSTREEPAKALVLFSELLNLRGPVRILDAGCGNGRNSIYLAKRGCRVTAVDFSVAAIGETRRRVVESGVTENVAIVEYFLDDPAPFAEESFDFVLDAYTSCHFLTEEAARRFWSDMARVTRSEGHLLSILFTPEDEYYAQYLRGNSKERLVCDPANKISKRLYTEEESKAFFAQYFKLKYFAKFEFDDFVNAQSYRRVVLTSVLQKRSV